MSTLFYGGDPETGAGAIMLVRCELLDCHREPIYNGPDYLYTRHVLRVRAVYNREINAYDWQPGAPAAAVNATALQQQAVAVGVATRDYVPGLVRLGAASGVGALPAGIAATVARVQRGMDAPTTDAALRHKLLQPRRQLIWLPVAAAGLVSPSINADGTPAACDAKNGPTPLSCDVVQVVGGKSYIVDFAIETYVNDATMYRTTPSALLSHRWGVHESFDQDYYATRVIDGVAHFRTDRLAFLGAVADDYRQTFWHPRLPGFKRAAVDVDASPDGGVVHYRIVDRELALSIIPAGVTRIEAFQTVEGGSPRWEELPGNVIVEIRDLVKRAIETRGGSLVADIPRGMLAPLWNILPKTTITITARVWGRPFVLRKSLENVALRLILSRFNTAFAEARLREAAAVARITAGTTIRLTHDLAGTFVEATATKSTAIPLTITNLAEASNLELPNVGQFFPVQNTTTSPAGGILGSADSGDGNGMDLRYSEPNAAAGSFLTRGSWAKALITAALLGQDATPATATVPRDSLGLTTP